MNVFDVAVGEVNDRLLSIPTVVVPLCGHPFASVPWSSSAGGVYTRSPS